jgi:hypothetical protein
MRTSESRVLVLDATRCSDRSNKKRHDKPTAHRRSCNSWPFITRSCQCKSGTLSRHLWPIRKRTVKPAILIMTAVLTAIALAPVLTTHAHAAFEGYVPNKGKSQGGLKGETGPNPAQSFSGAQGSASGSISIKRVRHPHGAHPGVYIHSNPTHLRR